MFSDLEHMLASVEEEVGVSIYICTSPYEQSLWIVSDEGPELTQPLLKN